MKFKTHLPKVDSQQLWFSGYTPFLMLKGSLVRPTRYGCGYKRSGQLLAALLVFLELTSGCRYCVPPAAAQYQNPHPELPSGWRMVRSSNPRGGPDAVSIMHTADLERSDPDFAGIMIRCATGTTEVVVILIRSFPLRTRPRVTLNIGALHHQFEATIVPPGSALLLPLKTEALVARSPNADLSMQIVHEQRAIRGVVPLDGLKVAFSTLVASCPAPTHER